MPYIYQYAGNGTPGLALNGLALHSPLFHPQGVAVDAAGDVYTTTADDPQVLEVTPDGNLSIIAGNGSSGTPIAGVATSSPLGDPFAVAVDSSGNVYVADVAAHVVEKITPQGNLSIFAGTGTSGGTTPGPATLSDLGSPDGLAVDAAGNVYIADANDQEVLRVTPSGTLSTYAGGGAGGSPTPGPATSSSLNDPEGLAEDSAGNLYIANNGSRQVLKVSASGTLSVIAGTGNFGTPMAGPATSSLFGTPHGVAVDPDGDVYISDEFAAEILQVTPGGTLSVIAGTGSSGPATFGGPASASSLFFPAQLAAGSDGSVYVADNIDWTIDRIAPATPTITGVPSVSGMTVEGDTLTAVPGSWTGSSLSYAYQWELCDSDGANCVPISAATASTFTPTAADVGDTLVVTVTAANGGGSVTISSSQTSIITAPPPTPTPTPTPSPTPTPTTSTSTTPTTPTTPVTAPTPTPASAPVGVTLPAQVLRSGLSVSSQGQLGMLLDCPTTTTGCDANGTLSIQLSATRGLAGNLDPLASSEHVISRFAGIRIAGGHSRLVSVRLTPTTIAYLQKLGVRRVRVTLVTDNHLDGGTPVLTTERVWLRIPPVFDTCPLAGGAITDTNIGAISLGESRARARHLLPRFQRRNYHTDDFCLAGGPGIRVGYGSARLLGAIAQADRSAAGGKIVLALTANKSYSLDGVSPGAPLATAVGKLTLGPALHLGLNDWYIVAGAHENFVLKVRHGTVLEVGLANRRLTSTRADQASLLRNF